MYEKMIYARDAVDISKAANDEKNLGFVEKTVNDICTLIKKESKKGGYSIFYPSKELYNKSNRDGSTIKSIISGYGYDVSKEQVGMYDEKNRTHYSVVGVRISWLNSEGRI